MKRCLTLTAGLWLSGAAVSPVYSQDAPPGDAGGSPFPALSSFEIETEIDADLQLALGDDGAPRNAPYADIRARLEAETVRPSGLRWGVRLAGGGAAHDGLRGAGGEAACRTCPPAGLVTGLYRAGAYDPAEVRARLSQAEVYVTQPYAELRAGIGQTAASGARPAKVRAFRLAGADGPLADPTGAGLSDTGLSLTSPALTVGVETRRLVGVSAAASFTPDSSACGLDQCRPGPSGTIDSIWSAALSFDRRAPSDGVRWAAFVGGEIGSVDEAPAPGGRLEDPWIASLAVEREAEGVTLSGRWLVTNDGLSQGRYEAASASAAYESGDWLYSVEAGLGRSDTFDMSATTLFFGASRLVGRNGLAGAGVQFTHSDPAGGRPETRTALILETGLRF